MVDRRRALIVSTGRDRGALAGARSLRRAGWSVGIGTPDGGGMPGSSRACDARHVVPRPRGDGAAFLDGVRQAVTAGRYDVVFGGGDDWMAALSAVRDLVGTRVAHPPADVVAAALDKVRLTECAQGVGFAVPHTEPATDAALDRWPGPVVVKCRAHWSPGQTRPHRIDARLFPDAASARALVDRIREAGAEPVLQRPVAGRLGALVGVFRDGRLRGRVQQSSPRLWPTPYGASARAVTVAVDEALAARAEALLTQLRWEGLVELQLLTGEDGVPHLIDLNGRFYGSLSLADAALPGLIDAWGRSVLGEPVPELPDGRVGLRYSWAAGDLRRAVTERRGGLATDLAETLGWAATARHSVWDPRDPGPARHLLAARLHRLPGVRHDGAAGAEGRGGPVPASSAGTRRFRDRSAAAEPALVTHPATVPSPAVPSQAAPLHPVGRRVR